MLQNLDIGINDWLGKIIVYELSITIFFLFFFKP